MVPLGPAVGVTVEVYAAGTGALLSTGLTDADGLLVLTLDDGDYWIGVPWSNEVAGLPGADAVGHYLPDGRLVFDWSEAAVPRDSSVNLAITIPLA